MKTIKTLAIAFFAIIMLSACGGGNTPEDTLMKYFEAAKTVDLKAAQKCCTKDVAAKFDQLISEFTEDDIKELRQENNDLTVKFIRADIDGDNATIYFEESHGDHNHEKSLPMRKEDGEWKIAKFY